MKMKGLPTPLQVDREIFAALKDKKVAIFTHINADVDSIVSAYFIKKLIESYGGNAYIVVPNDIDKSASNVVNKYHIPINEFSTALECDEFIVVDTHSNEYIGKAESLFENKKAFLVIDHHSQGIDEEIPSENYIISPNYSSNLELVIDMFDIEVKDKRERELALLAIISDYYGANMEIPKDIPIDSKLLDLIIPQISEEEKKIVNSAIEDSVVGNNSNIKIIVSKLKSDKVFPAIVAKEILKKNNSTPCICLVMYPKNGNMGVSLRTNTSIDLSEVSSELELYLSKKLGVDVSSGGHKGAAGITLPIPRKNESRFSKLLIDVSRKILDKYVPSSLRKESILAYPNKKINKKVIDKIINGR